jgi:muconolactone delta-isomerase
MHFFATGSITQPDQLAQHEEEETRVLTQLREQGTVTAAFRYTGKHGVIGIFTGPTLDDIRQQIGRLPFVALGYLTFQYEEIAEL